jgi:hypothetical protein
MSSLALQRCWNHSSREAVARCPECGRSYCRECVVEHEDRIICSGCLARITATNTAPEQKLNLWPALRLACTLSGVAVAWFIYFNAGRALLSIPDRWHAQTLWEWTWGKSFSDSNSDDE